MKLHIGVDAASGLWTCDELSCDAGRSPRVRLRGEGYPVFLFGGREDRQPLPLGVLNRYTAMSDTPLSSGLSAKWHSASSGN